MEFAFVCLAAFAALLITAVSSYLIGYSLGYDAGRQR